MNHNLMPMVDVSEIRAAHEAATWYQRLEDGLSEADVLHYVRWLEESPENMEALLFLYTLCNSLCAEGSEITQSLTYCSVPTSGFRSRLPH